MDELSENLSIRMEVCPFCPMSYECSHIRELATIAQALQVLLLHEPPNDSSFGMVGIVAAGAIETIQQRLYVNPDVVRLSEIYLVPYSFEAEIQGAPSGYYRNLDVVFNCDGGNYLRIKVLENTPFYIPTYENY